MSGYCISKKHYWLDEICRERCCNGYKHCHFSNRIEALDNGAEQGGIVDSAIGGVFAWVKEEKLLEAANG